MAIIHFINDAKASSGGAQAIMHSIHGSCNQSSIYGFDCNYLGGKETRSNILYCFIFFFCKFFFSRSDKIVLHHRIFLPFCLLFPRQNVYFVCHNIFPRKNIIFKFKYNITFIAVSEKVSEYLSDFNHKNKVILIQNGIKVDSKNIRKFDKPPSRKMQIFYIGRLAEQKGIDLLLNVFKKINRTYPEVHLNIIGEPSAEYPSTGININYLGYKNTPFKFCQDADLVVVPSRYEGFGLVYYEAMEHKHHILSSDLDVFKRFNNDDCTRFFKKNCEKSLEIEMIKLIKEYYTNPESYLLSARKLTTRHKYLSEQDMNYQYKKLLGVL